MTIRTGGHVLYSVHEFQTHTFNLHNCGTWRDVLVTQYAGLQFQQTVERISETRKHLAIENVVPLGLKSFSLLRQQ